MSRLASPSQWPSASTKLTDAAQNDLKTLFAGTNVASAVSVVRCMFSVLQKANSQTCTFCQNHRQAIVLAPAPLAAWIAVRFYEFYALFRMPDMPPFDAVVAGLDRVSEWVR